MGKFSLYKIPLSGLSEGTHTYDYKLENQFFKLINDGESDINKGTVNVDLTVRRSGNIFELNFVINGEVNIPCDRCLDDMPMEIDTKNKLIIKFGKEYSEESDEIVIIPEDDGEINIAWFLYEFISLDIPIKHVHAPGKCNRIMSTKLNKHKATSNSDGDSEEENDMEVEDDIQDNATEDSGAESSQWDSLKNLNFDE